MESHGDAVEMPRGRRRARGYRHTWAIGDRAYGVADGAECEVIGVDAERVKVRWTGGPFHGYTKRLPPDAITLARPDTA